MTLHCGGELGLSQAAYLHLAASIPNMTLAIDNERDYLGGDIITDAVRRGAREARRAARRRASGVEVDLAALEHYKVTDIKGAYLDPGRPGWFPTKPAY